MGSSRLHNYDEPGWIVEPIQRVDLDLSVDQPNPGNNLIEESALYWRDLAFSLYDGMAEISIATDINTARLIVCEFFHGTTPEAVRTAYQTKKDADGTDR
jgi:hypothetical protein